MIDDKIYLDVRPLPGQAVNLTILRDYFAAKAMQGIISNIIANPQDTAKDAYTYADAMLKARESTKQDVKKR